MRWRDDAIAVLVADEKLVVPRKKPDRRRDVAARAWAARDVIEPPPVLVAEGPECRSDPLDRRANPRRRLSRELRDVGDGHRPERRKAPADEGLQRVLLRRPPAARDPMARRDVRRIGPAVVPVSAGRRRYEIGVRAHEAPYEPVERSAKPSADAVLNVLEHLLLRTRTAREGAREGGDLLWIHTAADLQAVPRAALEILRRDRVRVEVSGGDQVKRAAHEPRADDLVAFDRRPEFLASKVFESRPKRDIGGRRPLGLQGRETLDRGDDPNARALQEQLSREHRAIELAQGENGPLAGPLVHPRTARTQKSGANKRTTFPPSRRARSDRPSPGD